MNIAEMREFARKHGFTQIKQQAYEYNASTNTYHTKKCRFSGKEKNPITLQDAKEMNAKRCHKCKPEAYVGYAEN